VGGSLIVRGSSILDTLTPEWVEMVPSYTPIIDGLAGWGMETTAGSGRHEVSPTTSLILVDTLSTSASDGTLISPASGTQPALYRGSLRWASERTFPRTIMPTVSGMYDMQRTQNVDNPYATFAFQTAPSPGFFIKNGNFQVRANDTLFWHMQCYNGDEPSGQGFNVRRGFTFGSGLAAKPARCVVAWGSMYWSIDELVAGSQGGTDLTIIHSVIAEGLADPTHAEWPHAFGGSFDIVNRVSMARNLIAHVKARAMLSRIDNFVMCNNVVYNAKGASNIDPTNTGGQGVDLHATIQGTPAPTFTNIIANYFIKGPNYSSQFGGDTPIYIRGTNDANFPLLDGSRVYISSNTDHGWGFATQADFATLAGSPVSGVLAAARIDASWPDGFRGTLPTIPKFLDLASNTIGARPKDRQNGRDGVIWTQAKNKIAGSGDLGFIPQTVAEVGGYLSVPTHTIDLFSSSAMQGDPLPLSNWLAPGTNPNKTVGEEWLYRQHLRV
jgi:hypothetical protein